MENTDLHLRLIAVVAAALPALAVIGGMSLRPGLRPLRRALWIAFGLGFVAAPVIGLLGIVPVALIYTPSRELLQSPTFMFLASAIPEEIGKWLLVVFFAFRHEDVTRPMHAFVLALAVSLGFAATEGIFYVVDSPAWVLTAAGRAVTSVPMHVVTGIMMGYFGARMLADPERWRTNAALMLAVPILLHGLFNFWVVTAGLAALGHGVEPGLALERHTFTAGLLAVVLEAPLAVFVVLRMRRAPWTEAPLPLSRTPRHRVADPAG